MKTKYYSDTVTLMLTFSNNHITETYDLNEDILFKKFNKHLNNFELN